MRSHPTTSLNLCYFYFSHQLALPPGQEVSSSWAHTLSFQCSCSLRPALASSPVPPCSASPTVPAASRRVRVQMRESGRVAWRPVALCSRHGKINGVLSSGPLFRGWRSAWGKCQSLTGEAGWKMSSFTGKSCEKGNVSVARSLSAPPLRKSLFFALCPMHSLSCAFQTGAGGRENYSADFWRSDRKWPAVSEEEEGGEGIRQGVNQTGFCQMRACPLPLQQQCMTWAVYFTPYTLWPKATWKIHPC